jgi:hypothetical protein
MKLKSTHAILGAALFALPGLIHAQQSAHYVPGVEGIKGASLPPPGIYLRDYNVAYFARRANDAKGNEIPGLNPDVFVYANVPRVLWITEQQVLGGFLGVDALLPVQYTDVNLAHDRTFGLGDFFAEGTWSRHLDRFDLSLGYGIWAPTGDSGVGTTRAGLGYWTHMFTAGATWYVDADKKWAVSLLNRYEISSERDDTSMTPGQAYTLEWGLSRALCKTVEVGPVGYYQQQVTSDSGANTPRNRVAAAGPEITAFCSKLGVNTSLRYLYEFMAENRFQGHTVALTFTKRF